MYMHSTFWRRRKLKVILTYFWVFRYHLINTMSLSHFLTPLFSAIPMLTLLNCSFGLFDIAYHAKGICNKEHQWRLNWMTCSSLGSKWQTYRKWAGKFDLRSAARPSGTIHFQNCLQLLKSFLCITSYTFSWATIMIQPPWYFY